MRKVAILTDSGADITPAVAKELGIYVIRMPLVIDDKEYTEGVDINTDELHNMLKEHKLSKTAQTSPGTIAQMYEELLKSYDEVLYIPLSSGLSGQYQTALQVAKEYDGRVTVVDAKSACFPIAILCKDARKLLDKGKSVEEVKEIIEANENLYAVIIPADINYLKLGGRISAAAASLANLFRIVPILSVKDGLIDVVDKVRTEKKAISVGLDYVDNVENKKDYYWMVIHDHREEDAKEIARELKERVGQEVMIEEFGAVILSHAGPDTLAFGHIKKFIDED